MEGMILHDKAGKGETQIAEGERFELSVEVCPLRRFSKPLVSATHPPLLPTNNGE
jgi:hypothetical protein